MVGRESGASRQGSRVYLSGDQRRAGLEMYHSGERNGGTRERRRKVSPSVEPPPDGLAPE